MEDSSLKHKTSHTGSWVSLSIGGPVGLVTVAIVFFGTIVLTEIITDESLSAIVIFALYGYPSLALVIALLPTLWFAGRYGEKALRRGQSLIKTSFQYCLLTNLFLWSVFTIVYTMSPLFFALNLIVPLLFFGVGTFVSTFTIGLLICSVIRKRVEKKLAVVA